MNADEFDTIVVGARCAGAPLATQLARGGQKVLLLDADKLPSDQPMSTHCIYPIGVDWLDELGVGARVRELSPPIRTLRMQMKGSHFHSGFQRGRAARCLRRSLLDPLLQDAAVAAGAELRDQTRVVGLLRDGERVCGVEATANGERYRFRARVVVGADGRNSTVAELAGAKEYLGYDNPRFMYWAYWPAPPAWTQDSELRAFDSLIDYGHDGTIRVVFQADSDLLLLAVAPNNAELDAWRGDYEARYLRELRATPLTARLVEGNTRASKLLGLKKLRFFFREAAGPGFALVGDAGLHKDPTPGLGITDALRDARNLARAILEGGDRALVRYHRQRDVDSIDLFSFAKDMGDPSYINPINEIVYRNIGSRPDLLARMSAVADRELSPYWLIPASVVMRWMVGATLGGHMSAWPSFWAVGKRGAEVERLRRERIALREAMT